MSIGSFSSVTKQREVHTKPCGHVSETGGHASSGGAVTTVHSSGARIFFPLFFGLSSILFWRSDALQPS